MTTTPGFLLALLLSTAPEIEAPPPSAVSPDAVSPPPIELLDPFSKRSGRMGETRSIPELIDPFEAGPIRPGATPHDELIDPFAPPHRRTEPAGPFPGLLDPFAS